MAPEADYPRRYGLLPDLCSRRQIPRPPTAPACRAVLSPLKSAAVHHSHLPRRSSAQPGSSAPLPLSTPCRPPHAAAPRLSARTTLSASPSTAAAPTLEPLRPPGSTMAVTTCPSSGTPPVPTLPVPTWALLPLAPTPTCSFSATLPVWRGPSRRPGAWGMARGGWKRRLGGCGVAPQSFGSTRGPPAGAPLSTQAVRGADPGSCGPRISCITNG